MLKLESTKTKKLSQKLVREICNLKNSQWKFGIKSQLEYFKKNVKLEDIHNCLYFNNKLIGYTLLRKRTLIFKNKKTNYLLFDTMIIKNNMKRKKLSSLMMLFNNNIILNQKKTSFLICKNELVNFYKKFFWIKLKNKIIKIIDHNFDSNGMLFNCNISQIKRIKKPMEIYINE